MILKVPTDLIVPVAVETVATSIGAALLWRRRKTGIGPFARGVPLFGSILLGMIAALGLVTLLLFAVGA